MNTYPYAQEENTSPATSFQKLCQVMLDGSSKNLNKKNVEDFRVILHIIMRECSKANIESGKTWVFDHCQTPAHAAALMEYILTLSKSRSAPEDRIHMIYLLNDILFHTARKQLMWMRDAMLPLLVPLLKLAFDAAQNPELQAKIMKVITFWGDKQVFEQHVINNMKRDVTGRNSTGQQQPIRPPSEPLPHRQSQTHLSHQQQHSPSTTSLRSQPTSQYQSPQYQPTHYKPQQSFPQTPSQQYPPRPSYQPPSQMFLASPPPTNYNQYAHPTYHARPQQPENQSQQNVTSFPPTPPQKPYHQLPAGLMLLAKTENYSPIDPSAIKVPHPRPLPSKEIKDAVDDFYKGLDLSASDDIVLDDKHESCIDAQGWEKGYLDGYMNLASQRKIDAIAFGEKYKPPGREERRDRSPYRGYTQQHSRSRSPSHHRRRSYSRSRSRSPPRGRRMSPGRGRSPPRRRERTPPRRGRSPPGYRKRYSRSRSRSPPAYNNDAFYGSSNSSMSFDVTTSAENRYMGLGSNSRSDEFDSFRKSRSQAYSKRESYQPVMCYKCNKPGHLARECNSL